MKATNITLKYSYTNVCINYEWYKKCCFNRIDVSEGIDVNNTSEPKEYIISYHWYFLYKGFKFQLDVCNECYNVLMISINLSNIAILSFSDADIPCIISGISKSEAMDL